MEDSIKIIANNKKAFHEYFVDEVFECGIELFGTEVKSIRLGHCSIKESYVRIIRNELMIIGMHVNPYEKGNIFNKDPMRTRRLLVHRQEIRKISSSVSQKGTALIPLEVYFKGSLVKVKIGLCRGKKLYDKREDLALKTQKRELERSYKSSAIKM